MDDARSLIAEAHAAGVLLEASDGRLIVHARGPIPGDLVERLRANREAIIEWIASPSPTATVALWIGRDGTLAAGPLRDDTGAEGEP